MAAIDQLRQAVQDARAAGLWQLPASEDACYPGGDLPATDQTVILRLLVLALRDVYQQTQQNTADIQAIKAKLGL